MSDAEQRKKIETYIDGWMLKLNDYAKDYQQRGMSPEDALDRATRDVRMEIRRAPPVDLT